MKSSRNEIPSSARTNKRAPAYLQRKSSHKIAKIKQNEARRDHRSNFAAKTKRLPSDSTAIKRQKQSEIKLGSRGKIKQSQGKTTTATRSRNALETTTARRGEVDRNQGETTTPDEQAGARLSSTKKRKSSHKIAKIKGNEVQSKRDPVLGPDKQAGARLSSTAPGKQAGARLSSTKQRKSSHKITKNHKNEVKSEWGPVLGPDKQAGARLSSTKQQRSSHKITKIKQNEVKSEWDPVLGPRITLQTRPPQRFHSQNQGTPQQ
ncbi:hypothetical protein F4604DRAFT_1693942 [Suillus subluteus]|nr:hypothetical protein F4604DRAFT_1693942 [Suillus subluteus]